MKRKVFSVSLIIIITSIVSISATMFIIDSSGIPEDYIQHKIDSKILVEQREVIVKLPRNYSKNISATYPVIYVFGGNTLTFNIAYDTDLLSRTGHFPEVIIVGIPNINQKTRQRDLTPPFMKQDIDEEESPLGKADRYLKYIENEVIPLIEKEYRTKSERVSVGHSREGLLVMYSLIAKPKLFAARLALSPALWRENNIFVTHMYEKIDKLQVVNTFLYMSMGENEVEKMKNAFNQTIDLLKVNGPRTLKWLSYYTPDATHNNNAILSAPLGINKYFNN